MIHADKYAALKRDARNAAFANDLRELADAIDRGAYKPITINTSGNLNCRDFPLFVMTVEFGVSPTD